MTKIVAKDEGATFELVPAGTYIARCYSMVHLGTSKGSFQGKEIEQNKVRITWELPTEMKVFKEENGEQPLSISREFTLSMSEKANLRKFLEGWRGKAFTAEEAKAFDISNLVGKPCVLSVIHKLSKEGKAYAMISSASTLMKGAKCPPQINPSFVFSMQEFDQEKFDSLPDFLKKKVAESYEYKALTGVEELKSEHPATSPAGQYDDLPF